MHKANYKVDLQVWFNIFCSFNEFNQIWLHNEQVSPSNQFKNYNKFHYKDEIFVELLKHIIISGMKKKRGHMKVKQKQSKLLHRSDGLLGFLERKKETPQRIQHFIIIQSGNLDIKMCRHQDCLWLPFAKVCP